jgi:hypothetical protein
MGFGMVYINDWTSPSASVLFFSFAINVIQWVLLSIVTEPSHGPPYLLSYIEYRNK